MDITSKLNNPVLTGKKSLTEHDLKKNINYLWLAMVRFRKNGIHLRNDKHDTICHRNFILKFYNVFAILKAIGKQASIT